MSWKPNSGNGEIIHTWDLSRLEPSQEKIYLIKLLRPEPVSVSIPQSTITMDIVFFDEDDQIISKATISAGASQPKKEKSVYFVDGLVKRVIVLPGGWLDKNPLEALYNTLEIAFIERIKK